MSEQDGEGGGWTTTHRRELAEGENLGLRAEQALLGVEKLDRVPSHKKPPNLCLPSHTPLAYLDLLRCRCCTKIDNT